MELKHTFTKISQLIKALNNGKDDWSMAINHFFLSIFLKTSLTLQNEFDVGDGSKGMGHVRKTE